MSYSESVYKKAGDEIRRRKEAAENEHKFKCAEIYSAHPEVEAVSRKLEGTSKEYLQIVLKGGPKLEKNIEDLKHRTAELNQQKRAIFLNIY